MTDLKSFVQIPPRPNVRNRPTHHFSNSNGKVSNDVSSSTMAQQASPSIRFGSVRLLQDAPLGRGAYGQVWKATLGELPCAAKLLHPILMDPTNRALFEQECRFLSEIRHPNVVQYLGVAHDPVTGLPILLMELMDDSLTHFLEQSEQRLPYHVQVNISHDIALALAFLHETRILHRDLSSNNVLLISVGASIRAKVNDFTVNKLTELNLRMTGLTKCPGTPAYMSPEALSDPPVYTEKLDCFQAGVLMIQTITRKFPDPGPAMTRVRDARFPTGWVNVPVPEAERRHNHLSLIPRTHPILPIATDCLKDTDTERLSAQQICHRLSALKEAPQYGQSLEARGGERDGEVQERELLIQQLRQENEEREREVREKEGEIRNLQDELQRTEEEKQRLSRRLDLTNVQIQQTLERRRQVEDQLRDEIHQLRESNTRVLQEKDATIRQNEEKEREVKEKEGEIGNLRDELQRKDATICQLQQSQQFASYTSQVSGPGLQSATANHPTHVLVELTDSSGRLCSLQQNVTAELQAQGKSPAISAAVAVIFPSGYEVSYTAVSRGQHKLHIRVNGREINGSPFTMTVYPDPTQLGHPVRVVTGMNKPYDIAFNSRGEMIVTENGAHKVSVFDIRGKRVRTFGSRGKRPEQMQYPAGIAVDDVDNIYVGNMYKLQKFTSRGKLIKCVGQEGSKEGEFDVIRGLTVHREQVYVCDRNNHRIQVFDLDLNFIRSIGSRGKGRGEFNKPYDVKFDTAGNMYVADFLNDRVQVMDSSGQFIREFGQEGKGKLNKPSALHFADKYVYVSDYWHYRIVVYETSGQFVTSFGRKGQREGEFQYPVCITSCADGFIYVCDWDNNRVQVF